MAFCDFVDTLFDDEFSPSKWSRSFVPVAGGVWLLSGSIHEMCEMLRTTRLKIRLSREMYTEAWKRFLPVKYPPAVL